MKKKIFTLDKKKKKKTVRLNKIPRQIKNV